MAPGSPRSKGTDNRSVLGPESGRGLEERLAGTVSGQDWNDAFWRDAILRHVRGVKNQMRRLLKHCPRATCGLCARLRYVLARASRGVKNQMRRLLKHCPRATCGLCARLRY